MRSHAPGIGHPDGAHLDRMDQEIAVDRHARPTCRGPPPARPHAGQQRIVVILGVDQMRVDVEQAVVAPIAFVRDAALMQALAPETAGGWERHRRRGRLRGRARAA
jgi:hypothetical protein